LHEFDEAGGSIEPVFRAVCQDQGMQDDPTYLDPDGFLIGHAFKGEFLYLRFRRARDVASRVGVWEGFHAPYWHRALLVGLRPDPGELGVSRASGPLVRSASMPREGLTGAGDHQISDLLCESKARTRMGKRSERPTLD